MSHTFKILLCHAKQVYADKLVHDKNFAITMMATVVSSSV